MNGRHPTALNPTSSATARCILSRHSTTICRGSPSSRYQLGTSADTLHSPISAGGSVATHHRTNTLGRNRAARRAARFGEALQITERTLASDAPPAGHAGAKRVRDARPRPPCCRAARRGQLSHALPLSTSRAWSGISADRRRIARHGGSVVLGICAAHALRPAVCVLQHHVSRTGHARLASWFMPSGVSARRECVTASEIRCQSSKLSFLQPFT